MKIENVWQDISPHFYTSFWTMTMYDIATPKEAYEKEVNKLKTQIKQVDNNQELNSGTSEKLKVQSVVQLREFPLIRVKTEKFRKKKRI